MYIYIYIYIYISFATAEPRVHLDDLAVDRALDLADGLEGLRGGVDYSILYYTIIRYNII